jgi:hypothetical protein
MNRMAGMALKMKCAWCQADLGERASKEVGETHGICKACQQKVLTNHFLRAQHREAGMTIESIDAALCLKQDGHPLAFFIPGESSKADILEEADKHLHHSQ